MSADRAPGSEVAAADPASCRGEMVASLAGEIARYHIEKFGASATQPTYRLAMEIAETVLAAADVVPRSVAEELAEALKEALYLIREVDIDALARLKGIDARAALERYQQERGEDRG